jgi:hypothetical protein
MTFSMTAKSLPSSIVIPLGSRIVTALPPSWGTTRNSRKPLALLAELRRAAPRLFEVPASFFLH